MSTQTTRSRLPESSGRANRRFTRNVNTSEAADWVSRAERRSSLPGVSAASTRRSVGPEAVTEAGAATAVDETGPAVAATAASAAAAAAAAAREAKRRPTIPGYGIDVTNG
jgi:hypothetical protein